MTEQLQLRRGTAAQVAAFTGAQGEVVVDTTNNRAVVNDGSTAGGWPAAKLVEVVTNTRTSVSDAAYSALATDRSIAYAALTAARVVTLPASSAYPTGTTLTVFDESGACSATNTITLARGGSDTIDGATSAVISSAYGFLALQSNGAGKWTIVDQATSNLGPVGVGTPADPNNPLSVYGAAALFNGVNFNVTVNKTAAGDTASFIFEDGFSGRGQIGLCGDDNFHFKVSANGSTWFDALDINASTGNVGVGTSTPDAPLNIVTSLVTNPKSVAFEYDNSGVIRTQLFSTGMQFWYLNSGSAEAGVIQYATPGGYPGIAFFDANGVGRSQIVSPLGGGLNFGANSSASAPSPSLAIKATGQVVLLGAQADQSKVVQTPTTGFSITIGNATTTTLLTPSATLASGTITMPATPVDGQIARVLSSQTVTSLTVSPNSGQSISGAPSTIGPTTPFAMIYDLASATWYRTV
jgi:hypothetical protein